MELKDSVAIVTGGARGIGRGIAYELAKEGARIVIADLPAVSADARRDDRARSSASAAKPSPSTVDVRDFAQCQAMVQAAIDKWGQVDVLVNNAGVIRIGPVVAFAEDDWDLIQDVNLKGTFLCSKAVVRAHDADGAAGRSSTSRRCRQARTAGASAYCASKWAVIGFTQALADEMAPFDVTVNAICPGEVDTLHVAGGAARRPSPAARGITKEAGVGGGCSQQRAAARARRRSRTWAGPSSSCARRTTSPENRINVSGGSGDALRQS